MHMDGVDKVGQIVPLHVLERNGSMKWHMKLLKRCLNVSVHIALVSFIASM